MIAKMNKDLHKVEPLFGSWQESMIWSCLQGVMGEVYVNDIDHPDSAMAILGDFCILAGRSDRELITYKRIWGKSEFVIMLPQNKEWEHLIEDCYQNKAKKVTRYALKKESDVFDKGHLKSAVENLPKQYSVKMIDEGIYRECKHLDWTKDFVAQYETYEKYQECGLGVVITKGNEILSGASSYSSFQGGIEIEIVTRKDYRRQGLAYVAGAQLILACLDKGWYPSWDAQNLWSVSLAKKLGYHFSHEYTAYEVCLVEKMAY